MKRREMIKTGALLTGATLVSPIVFSNTNFGDRKVHLPSYLKGY